MNERIAALGDALVAEGVRAVFGIPGRGLSRELAGVLDTRGVPFHAACHEGAAAIMAGAFGHRTRALGCSVSIRGPGLGNALPGILTNAYEHRAALHIAEALGPATPAFMMHGRLDHRAVARPCTKASATLGDPARTVRALADAAHAEVPGPVHLDLFAEDVPAFERHGPTRPDRRDRPAINACRLVLLSDGRDSSWFRVIGAMGCPAVQVKAADDLAAVLERWPWREGPIFVEAVFDPEPYAAMVGDLRAR